MSFFVGVDVSKEKFDACCIDEQGEKLFSLTCSMNREGFEKFIGRLPKDKSSFLVGMHRIIFLSSLISPHRITGWS